MNDIVEVEPGVFSILMDGAVFEGRLDGSVVSIAGVRYSIHKTDPRKYVPRGSGAIGHGRDSIKTPMPGKVVRILVNVGDDVEAGQGIAVVEAMKMQNELKTPHAGRVASIHVQADDSVNAATVIAVIE